MKITDLARMEGFHGLGLQVMYDTWIGIEDKNTKRRLKRRLKDFADWDYEFFEECMDFTHSSIREILPSVLNP
jgi:hypothetical protein